MVTLMGKMPSSYKFVIRVQSWTEGAESTRISFVLECCLQPSIGA